MSQPDHLTPEERQNLVAYLDGELGAEATRALEQKLTRSAAARREARALQKTWEMLDYLPRPAVPEDFTNKTLERLDTGQASLARRRRWLRVLGGATWAAALVIATLIGFQAATHLGREETPEPSAEEIRLLEHRDYWRYYEKLDSMEFLRELDRSNLFGEDS